MSAQQRLTEWLARELPGSGPDPRARVLILVEEASEIEKATNWEERLDEVADAAIACYGIAACEGFDLDAEVDRGIYVAPPMWPAIGDAARAVSKRHEGIRHTHEEWSEILAQAVVDVWHALLVQAGNYGANLDELVRDRLDVITARRYATAGGDA